jgi:uncharacterized RDD family membrane protein YckC
MSDRRARVSLLNIATPEGVTFSLPLAGPITRAVAFAVDYFVASMIYKVLMIGVGVIAMVSEDVGGFIFYILQLVVFNTYTLLCEMLWRGKTVGKHVVGLRVMDERGLRLQPSQVLVRNLVRFVDALPLFYAVGGAVCLFSRRCQRLGDLAAGTVVVRNIKIVPPDVEGILGGKYNSFRAYPHLEARLRQKVSAEEAQIALSALVRRDELDVEATVKLFETMAQRFRAAVKFPDEAEFGLSDEQYVRNVVDTLYRKAR